jgi:hypothetical protein
MRSLGAHRTFQQHAAQKDISGRSTTAKSYFSFMKYSTCSGAYASTKRWPLSWSKFRELNICMCLVAGPNEGAGFSSARDE